MAVPVTVERSRAIPVPLHQAFATTLALPLPSLFCRRYALLPPISAVRDQRGTWGDVGQVRTVVTSDGGTMRERLSAVDAPRSFSYQLSHITGPVRPLVDAVDGRWEFTPAGTGTSVTWRWTLHPRRAGAPVMPILARMWLGYAGQALEQLSDLLLASDIGQDPPG